MPVGAKHINDQKQIILTGIKVTKSNSFERYQEEQTFPKNNPQWY